MVHQYIENALTIVSTQSLVHLLTAYFARIDALFDRMLQPSSSVSMTGSSVSTSTNSS